MNADGETVAPSAAPRAVKDLDWGPAQALALGHAALELWGELLEQLPTLPVARSETPRDVRTALLREVPDDASSLDDLVQHLRELVLEHSIYPGHPRFMGYISGAGTAPGAVADLLAAAVNQNVGGWMLSPAATEIEQHVVRWFGGQFGFDDRCGGLVTSGGAAATLIGLKAARDHCAGWDVRREGVSAGRPLVCYASTESHVVSDRAADILGIGAANMRHVPVDAAGRLRVDELLSMIRADRTDDLRPFAVVGTAGTTATGAIDPLASIADVCAEEDIWFHVDGAYGAPAMLVEDMRPLFTGIERADSIAFDPHKWLYVPLGVGCIVVREDRRLPESFAVDASYVHQDREAVDRGDDLAFSGLQFSRGFGALKLWLSLLAHGRDAYARRIAHDVALARHLHSCVDRHPDFEPMSPPSLSITCFRYVPSDVDREHPDAQPYLDRLNERLMTAIQTDGRAFCSNAIVHGRHALRACIVNFRTEADDVETLLDVAAELGAALHNELGPPSGERGTGNGRRADESRHRS